MRKSDFITLILGCGALVCLVGYWPSLVQEASPARVNPPTRMCVDIYNPAGQFVGTYPYPLKPHLAQSLKAWKLEPEEPTECIHEHPPV